MNIKKTAEDLLDKLIWSDLENNTVPLDKEICKQHLVIFAEYQIDQCSDTMVGMFEACHNNAEKREWEQFIKEVNLL